jgi:xanthine dehydrogenase accessory factor
MRGQRGLRPVLVLGAGDVGSAVAHALFRAGAVAALQDGPAPPSAPRRGMAFADAFFDGHATLAGVTARRLATPVDLPASLGGAAFLLFFAGIAAEALAAAPWAAVVDARMRKRAAPEDLRPLVPLAVGLGPGFVAGDGLQANCHAAVETSWEALGALVRSGPTLPLRGEPRPIAGVGRERTAYAAAAGTFRTGLRIGDQVAPAQPVGALDGRPVLAPLAGVLRGLVRDGVGVPAGANVAEVDPRGDPALCFGLGERPRRIAAAVAAVLAAAGLRCAA